MIDGGLWKELKQLCLWVLLDDQASCRGLWNGMYALFMDCHTTIWGNPVSQLPCRETTVGECSDCSFMQAANRSHICVVWYGWFAAGTHTGSCSVLWGATRHWECPQLFSLPLGSREGQVLDYNTARQPMHLPSIWVQPSEGPVLGGQVVRRSLKCQLVSQCVGTARGSCQSLHIAVTHVLIPPNFLDSTKQHSISPAIPGSQQILPTVHSVPEMDLSGSFMVINTEFKSTLAQCFWEYQKGHILDIISVVNPN